MSLEANAVAGAAELGAGPDAGRRLLAGVARGGVANLIGTVVTGVAGFGVTALVARTLGAGRAGGFFAATAAFVLAGTVAKLGTQTSLVYFPARLRLRSGYADLRRCLNVGVWPVVAAAVLVAVALWLAGPALARLTEHTGGAGAAHATGSHGAGPGAARATGYVGQLRVLALFLPVAVLSDTLLAATRGWRVMRPTVVLDRLVRPLAQLSGIGALYLAGVRAPVWYALAWAGPYLPSAILAGYGLRRLLGQARVRELARLSARPATLSGAAFWRFTAPRAAASVAQLALGRVDVLLLASLSGLRQAALYAVAGRFVVLGQFANQAISQSVQPRLAELLSTGDRPGANTLYQTATGWLVFTAWPLFLGTAVFARTYLRLFGPGYRDATGVVLVLAGAMLLGSGCGMVDMMLSMAGRTSWNLTNVVLALGVNLAVDLALIPRLGALGAAIGLAAAIVTNNLVPLAQVAGAMGLHPFGAGTGVAAGLALASFGLLPLALVGLLGSGPGVAVLGAAGGGACYLVGATRFRGWLRLDAFTARRDQVIRPRVDPA